MPSNLPTSVARTLSLAKFVLTSRLDGALHVHSVAPVRLMLALSAVVLKAGLLLALLSLLLRVAELEVVPKPSTTAPSTITATPTFHTTMNAYVVTEKGRSYSLIHVIRGAETQKQSSILKYYSV